MRRLEPRPATATFVLSATPPRRAPYKIDVDAVYLALSSSLLVNKKGVGLEALSRRQDTA